MRWTLFDALKQPPYFHRQVHWMQSKFPDAKYADVEGICKSTPRDDIEDNDWSLTPGRYVGVAAIEDDPDFDFDERIEEINTLVKRLLTCRRRVIWRARQLDSSRIVLVRPEPDFEPE